MVYVINGETPFQILSSSFSIGPSQTGYELQVGADSKTFSTLFSVGANTPRMVTNVANGSYFRLKNNVGEVKVNWQRVCSEGGGGEGGSDTELAPVSEFPLGAMPGTVVAYSGASSAAGVYMYDGTDWNPAGGDVDLSNYYTSAQTEEKIASAVTPVTNHLAEVEEVTASALTELHNGLLEVSGRTVDLSGYYTSAQTEEAISAATAGKADAANISQAPMAGQTWFPVWNEQGIITGTSKRAYEMTFSVNGTDNRRLINTNGASMPSFYAPLSAGTAGEVLVSTGNGAPVWSAFTGGDYKTVVDFDKTPQSERATMYTTLKALYDGGSGATINKTYDFYKTVGTKQGLKIDYYTFSGNTMIFGKVVSPDNSGETAVYAQVLSIDSAGNVNVTTNTVGGGAGTGYWTSAETKTYVDSAITGVQDQIDTMDEVVSDALNDLNRQLVNKVSSSSVSTIWKGTQAEYDLIVTKDPATFYIIVSSN